jgi:mono/diheme cytochrome c family protein
MKKIAIVLVTGSLFASCELTNYVPPVTSQMTAAAKGQHVNLVTLSEGRVLFARRCIECHTLPALWRYRTDDWPDIVDSMAHRASLKPGERDAIVAYIRAVRSQK